MKALNILSIFYGSILLLSGITKSFGVLKDIKINIGGLYMNMSSPDSLFYIVSANFIGGASLIYFAVKTMNYTKYVSEKNASLDQSQPAHNTEEFSTLTTIASFYSMLLCVWLFFRALFILSSFEDNFVTYYPLFIFAFLYYVPFALVPLVLVLNKRYILADVQKRNSAIAFHKKRSKA